MPVTPTKTFNPDIQTTLAVIDDIFGTYQPRDFAIRLWDGTVWASAPGHPARFTVVLQHPGALRRMFLPPSELNLGEAYIYNDFDIEGDITAIFPVVDFLLGKSWGKLEQMRLGGRLLSLPKGPETGPRRAAKLQGGRHTQGRDRQAIAYHYDRSNDFYALWLDRRMVYSCAYFQTADDDLDTAQAQKLDYICRKLRLQPGERLLDIGCGWGGLVIYAAQHYGVIAEGITLSEHQAEWAQAHIQEAGLTDRCQVSIRDYREVAPTTPYDKLVSVGMFEHVGASLLSTYFKHAWKILRPGGIFLNHGIAANIAMPPLNEKSFFRQYVFPDSDLVPISTTLRVAEECSFEVRDVESLREHYALTLHHWVQRLEAHADDARRLTDEVTYRIWRLYMAGAQYNFQMNHNTIYQTLLAKPDHGQSGLPLTRADWYAPRS